MSVGYNLAGIKSPMVDKFINTMRSISISNVGYLQNNGAFDHVDEFEHIDADFINSIGDELCQAITFVHNARLSSRRNRIYLFLPYQ